MNKPPKFELTEKNKISSSLKGSQADKANFKSILRQNPPKVSKQTESAISKPENKPVNREEPLIEEQQTIDQKVPLKQSLPRKSKNKEPLATKKSNKLTQSTLPFSAAKKIESKNAQVATTAASGATLNTFASLRNLGSTCYINCIIQVMRYTPGFIASIHRLNKQLGHLESLVNLI